MMYNFIGKNGIIRMMEIPKYMRKISGFSIKPDNPASGLGDGTFFKEKLNLSLE